MNIMYLKNSWVSLITLALLTGSAVDCHAGGGGSRLVYDKEEKAKSTIRNINNSNIDSEEEEVVVIQPTPQPVTHAPVTNAHLLLLPEQVLTNCVIPLLSSQDVVSLGDVCRYFRAALNKSKMWTRLSEQLKRGTVKPMRGVPICALEEENKRYSEFLARFSAHLLQTRPGLIGENVLDAAFPSFMPEVRERVLWEIYVIQRRMPMTDDQINSLMVFLQNKNNPIEICHVALPLLPDKHVSSLEHVLNVIKDIKGNKALVCSLAKPLISKGLWSDHIAAIIQSIDTLQLEEGVELSDQERADFFTLVRDIKGQGGHETHHLYIMPIIKGLKALGVNYADIWKKMGYFIPETAPLSEINWYLESAKMLGDDYDQIINIIKEYNLHGKQPQVSWHAFSNAVELVQGVKANEREAVFSASRELLTQVDFKHDKAGILKVVRKLGVNRCAKIEAAKRLGLMKHLKDNNKMIQLLKGINHLTKDHVEIAIELEEVLSEDAEPHLIENMLWNMARVDETLATLKLAKACGIIRKGLKWNEISILHGTVGRFGDNKEAICLRAKERITQGMGFDEIRQVLWSNEHTGG